MSCTCYTHSDARGRQALDLGYLGPHVGWKARKKGEKEGGREKDIYKRREREGEIKGERPKEE